MKNVFVVIRREYLQRVRSRWFVASTVGGPLFLLVVTALPILVTSRSEGRQRTLAVVDWTNVLSRLVVPRLEEAGFTVDAVPPLEGVDRELLRRIDDGEIGGYLVLDEQTLARGRVTYLGTSSPGTMRRIAIRQAVTHAALEVRLGEAASAGDVASLLRGGELEVQLVTGASAEADEAAVAIGFSGAFILYMMIIFYAVAVMRGVLEEKTTRMVEIVISTLRPWELMLGKVLGIGAVGLTQAAVWILFGVVLALAGLPALATLRPDVLDPAEWARFVPAGGTVLLFAAFFLLGYFLYAALYASVGAMCSTEEEAQQAQFPVIMLLVVPILFLAFTIESPDTPAAAVLSLVPFFSPILMFARAASGAAAPWEIVLSLGLMAAAILGVAWAAGRIYRVGILMQGKKPTLPELWRWIREAR